MGFIVRDNVSIVDETCNTLYFIANEEEKMKAMKASFSKHGIDVEKYIKKDMKNFFKFIEKFKSKNKMPLEILKRYFKASDNGDSEYIAKMFMKNLIPDELTINRGKLLEMDEDKLKELVMKEILSNLDYFPEDFSLDDELENVDVSKEFMPFLINKCTLDGEVKWFLTIIAQEPKIYLIEMIDMIIESIDIFKETFKVMEKDVADTVSMIKSELEKNEKYIAGITGIKALENWDRDMYIQPSMINFNGVSFQCSRSFVFDIPRRDDLYFGWKIQELINIFQGNDKEGEILNGRLKCLSDKSKFTILKLLKEKPMFGQEIAMALSLTTATVSYHMNALLCAKLVFIERIENKIFYTINSECVDEIVEVLKKELK